MIEFIYRWLPRLFCCHCRSDRSFHIKGRQFPLCARCTGELAGIIAEAFLYRLLDLSIPVSAVFLLPLIIDGTVQQLTRYESTNLRRLATGILFGFGLTSLFFRSITAAFNFGIRLGNTYFH